MNRNLVAIAVALATSTLVVAQEKYTLKLKKSEKGDISVNSRESIKKENVTVTGQNGDVVQEKKQNIVEKYKYTEEIIAKEAGKLPTKLLRTYSEATKKTGEDAEKLKFHGQKVLIEKKADGYHFTIDDGVELKGEDAGHLAQTFNDKKPNEEEMEKLLLPAKPVAAGESWKIDSKKFAKLLGGDEQVAKNFDLDKSKAGGKLVKAYKKDGKQFGILEYTIDMPMSKLEGMFPCTPGSKMEMKITMDGCIDGTVDMDASTFSSKVKGSAEVIQDGKPSGFVIKFDISGDEKSTSEPAKK